MSDIALRVQGVGKRYRIDVDPASAGSHYRYRSLREAVGRFVRRPIRALASGRSPVTDANSFWALKDVDLEVKRGEVVGIIGRNGAGKSTLLKILSRITRPTAGRIDLYGRVGSLLEVGTGFHPELSGRENIFLNGSILGMTRAEVKSKFDEIVSFSEVEKFLDMPVKQYSSGMYTRLAFAVAAHLEPEILVVDEVLAVGDAAFQNKCLGKMKDVSRHGRTVLFVSHNMGAVISLCSRSVWLADGRVRSVGRSGPVVAEYLRNDSADGGHVTFEKGPLRSCRAVIDREGITFIAEYDSPIPIDIPVLGFVLRDAVGSPICGDNPRLSRVERPAGASTSGTVRAEVRAPKLRDGDYSVSLWFGDSGVDFVHYPDVMRLAIAGHDEGAATDPAVVGPVIPQTRWTFEATARDHA